jgi:CBS domain-containing protein
MNATVEDVMTTHVAAVHKNATFKDMAALMYSRRVKRLPVVDDNGYLIGIISRVDVLSVYSRPDGDIFRDITEDVILNDFLSDPARFTVTVKDGVVTIKGTPQTAAAGRDITGAIRHVEGVVAVRDRLSYPTSARSAQPVGPLF